MSKITLSRKHAPAFSLIALLVSSAAYAENTTEKTDVLLIGGGISQQKELYPMLERTLEKYNFWDALRVPIQPCQLGNQAGRLGAVWLAKQQ